MRGKLPPCPPPPPPLPHTYSAIAENVSLQPRPNRGHPVWPMCTSGHVDHGML